MILAWVQFDEEKFVSAVKDNLSIQLQTPPVETPAIPIALRRYTPPPHTPPPPRGLSFLNDQSSTYLLFPAYFSGLKDQYL